MVTTTQHKDARFHNYNEVRTIESVRCITYRDASCQSHTLGAVTVTEPLSAHHYAAEREYQAEVGLLSRTITVEGDAADSPPTDTHDAVCSEATDGSISNSKKRHTKYPCPDKYLTGHGGHVIFVGENVTARVSGVEFHRMGQTNAFGRYPVHFHLMRDAGYGSYVTDSSVHESYYRCIVVHGTRGAEVSRNVMYDATGHCVYLESGNEEDNTIEGNLAAHVHPIGRIATQGGQEQENVRESANLTVPADTTASPYYITNLNNTVVGNAAVGGWAGFALVNFPKVIGQDRNDPMVPKDKPTLRFDGNTVRSSGYWQKLAGCVYLGGFLEEDPNDGYKLEYNPGRNNAEDSLHGGPRKRRQPQLEDGTLVPNVFTNIKLSLCRVAGADWNVRGDWRGIDIHDIGDRTFNAFGEVIFKDVSVKCRTNNTQLPVAADPLGNERDWEKNAYNMFRAYDTG